MSSNPNFNLLDGILLWKEAEALRREVLVGDRTPALAGLGLVFGFPPTLAHFAALWLPLAFLVETYMGLVIFAGVRRVVNQSLSNHR